jgi:hypothetical protein
MSLISEIKEFAAHEIRPRAQTVDKSGCFPKEIIQLLAANNFLGVGYPIEFGGRGLDGGCYGRFLEHATKYCANVRNLFVVNVSMAGETILKYGTSEQIATWIPAIVGGLKTGAIAISEPEVGSDISAINTKYEKVGGEYRISGKKKWITLGGIADFFLVAAKRSGAIEVFIVESDRKGVERRDIVGLLGNRGSHIAEIEFRGVHVPISARLGADDDSTRNVLSATLDIGRYATAWSSVALTAACLEEMTDYARERVQFGQSLGAFQLVQKIVGDAAVKYHAGRELVKEAGRSRVANLAEASIRTVIAKYFCSRSAMEVAQDAVQLLGANGYTESYPVERYFREAKALEIIEGSSQVLIQTIGQHSLINFSSREH